MRPQTRRQGQKDTVFFIFLSFTATRDSDCHTVDQQKCNSFRRKTGSFVAFGPAVARQSPGSRKERSPIGGSGWQCPFPG